LGTRSIEVILGLANLERAKKAPKEGSKLDKMLKGTVFFVKKVDVYSKAVDVYVNKSPHVASLVWGSCRVLLQVRSLADQHEDGVADVVDW
jgi:hypothetical protein